MFLTFSDGFWGLQFPKNFPGGSAPLTPRQGLRPWTPLGAAPPDPRRSSLGGAPRHLTRAARYLLASLASSLPPMKNPAYGPGSEEATEPAVMMRTERAIVLARRGIVTEIATTEM